MENRTLVTHVSDDGYVPNSQYGIVIHSSGFTFTKEDPEEARVELETFAGKSGWSVDWLYPVYKRLHYHSTTHEALVVWSGSATLQIGGPRKGFKVTVRKSDILVLPAGVGHQALKRNKNFRVFGLYPIGAAQWDMLYGRKKDRTIALPRLKKLKAPPEFKLQ